MRTNEKYEKCPQEFINLMYMITDDKIHQVMQISSIILIKSSHTLLSDCSVENIYLNSLSERNCNCKNYEYYFTH
jgi:hypothetical protein